MIIIFVSFLSYYLYNELNQCRNEKKLSLEINYFCQFIFEHVFLDELSALNRVTICYSYSITRINYCISNIRNKTKVVNFIYFFKIKSCDLNKPAIFRVVRCLAEMFTPIGCISYFVGALYQILPLSG